ncbi:g6176 [Coccomyxa viridis]|uniref:G6176 protein n=1 Tax=Coccomyxa viridis TaxID=1274662 RepID=A0ABP1G1C1_9CHLO
MNLPRPDVYLARRKARSAAFRGMAIGRYLLPQLLDLGRRPGGSSESQSIGVHRCCRLVVRAAQNGNKRPFTRSRRVSSNGKPPSSPSPGVPPSSSEGDWGGWGGWGDDDPDIDWVDLSKVRRNGSREAARARRRKAKDTNKVGRDEFLRPMVDTTGIRYRIGFSEEEVTEEIREEFEENQQESWEGLRFGGILIAVPIMVGFIVSRIFAEPFYEVAQRYNSQVFALSDREKIEGAKEIHKHELRLRMDAAIGRAPPLSDFELQTELRREALHLAEEFRERNRTALLNLLSDSTIALTGFILLLRNSDGRGALFGTIGRVFSGFSDTAKAFLIIASTDILLGYHSEEGWTAAIHLLTGHYGIEVEEAPIYIFVAIVPVTMDAYFKLWIFRGLNRKNPAAAVTLKSMDRH